MNKKGSIYVFKNVFNGKTYVGQTIHFNSRIKAHKDLIGDSKFHNAIKKYGFNAFELFSYHGIEIEMLDFCEIELIKRLNSINHGYNLDSGGNKGKFLSEESRLKMSNIKKELYSRAQHPREGTTHTAESKEKMRKQKIGKPGPWLGKKRKNVSGSNHYLTKKILCVETNEMFDCSREVEEKYGYKGRCIRACCEGYSKTSYNFHWRYLDKKE